MDKNIIIDYLLDRFSEVAKKKYGKKNSVRFLSKERGVSGENYLQWKTIDSMNFVHRISMTFSRDGREILGMNCNCGEACGCIHVTAALLQGLQNDLISRHHREGGPEEVPVAESIPSEEAVPPEGAAPISSHPVALWEEGGLKALLSPVEHFPAATVPEPAYVWDGEIRQMEILLGQDRENEEDVYWHPNDTEEVFHTNLGIIGTMGTGKTQFTKSLVTQLYREQKDHKNYDGQPYHILIFDYKGDYNESKEDFVRAVNAKIYKPYRLPYNPFALIRGNSFRPLLPVHTANTFKDTLTKCFHLGPKQQQLLLDCILGAYGCCGILVEDPSTWDRPAPTFEQVYKIFLQKTENKSGDSLAAAMQKLYQFRIFSSEPQKTVSIGEFMEGVTVLDLSGFDGDIQSFVVAITLDQFYAQMLKAGSGKTDGRLRQLHSLILVDEADNFMKEDFSSLRKIMKEGREFGVGLVLSTQSLAHFVGGEDDYSRYILTWVVHNVSDLSQREVEYIYKLQPKSQEIPEIYGQIKSLAKHESILKIANSAPSKIRDKTFFELVFE